MDLGAAINCPVSGAAWGDVLRIVARAHMNVDPCAPQLFRVNRSFEYYWRLAAQTTALDMSRILVRSPGLRSAHEKLAVNVHRVREDLKRAAIVRMWVVKSNYVAGDLNTF